MKLDEFIEPKHPDMFQAPGTNRYETYEPKYTRKPKLTLFHINKLRKMREQRAFQLLIRKKNLGIQYFPDQYNPGGEGGDMGGGGMPGGGLNF